MDFASFQAANAGAHFSDWLQQEAAPYWQQATEHRFTKEIADGSLEEAVYARYLVQDYAFVTAFTGLVAQAAAYAPTMAQKRPYAGFLSVLVSEENTYFLESFQALGVSQKDIENPALHPVTLAFQAEIESAGKSRSYEEVLAVLLAAEWTYLTWGLACGERRPEQAWLAEWIELHACQSFEEFVMGLKAECDRVGGAASAEVQAAMRQRFVRLMELEAAFFDAAYEEG
ncbi:TenA family protein [Rhodovibrionaceae bacterium A322]